MVDLEAPAIDVDAWLDAATPRTDEVTVCNRGDLIARHAELVAGLAVATGGKPSSVAGSDSDGVTAVAEKIVAVEEEIQSSLLTIRLRSIGGDWAKLLGEHPPRKIDIGHDHNPETFPPAALAACAMDPKLTLEQATRMKSGKDALSDGEWNKLWVALLALNVTGMPRPKLAAATELLRLNERSSTMSENEAYPGASSSVESGDPSPSTTTTTPGV